MLSPTGQSVVEEDVGPEVHVASPLVSRRSQRIAQPTRASSQGVDEIDEAVVALDREQAARHLKLKTPGRQRNNKGESTYESESE